MWILQVHDHYHFRVSRAIEDRSDEAIFTFDSAQERANPLWRDVEEDVE